MIENDCLPSRVISSWFRGCLYGGELPGCPSYSRCRVEKTLYIKPSYPASMKHMF